MKPAPSRLDRFRGWVLATPVRAGAFGMITWGLPVGTLTPLLVLGVFGQLQYLRLLWRCCIPAGLLGGVVFGVVMYWKREEFKRPDE